MPEPALIDVARGAPQAESRVRVRYAETDKMGVVYYANYLVWFEVGRCDLFRNLGATYLQKACEQMQTASRGHELDRVRTLAPTLEEAFADAERALRDIQIRYSA